MTGHEQTMTDVIAQHSNLEWSFEYGGFICSECGWQETYARPYAQEAEAEARAAHQAAALSAAGFGPVAEARAQALEDAAAERDIDGLFELGWVTRNHLRARAAAERGQG